MPTERSFHLAAVLILVALAERGSGARAQQPAPATPVITPESLSIPVQPPSPPPSSVLGNYPAVSAERLKRPADGEWLMVRRTYDGWGYSPLDQINASNVSRLQPVWTMSTGMNNGHEAAPVVNGGVMFVSTSFNQVLALDATSGVVLWKYRSPSPSNVRGKPVSRGVSLYGDKVFTVLTEAVLVALDARSGKEVWKTTVGDNSIGEYMTAPPLVADGKLITGISGGDGANRGFVAAYDPETNLVYWGVGNGFPWVGFARPGDNLYTASTVAIDVATGAIKGHFQYTPNESWDWDEVSPPILVDYRRGGRTIKGLINFARSGYLYFLERTAGPIKFVEGKPYVQQNVFRSLDPVTGRPDIDPARKPDIGKLADFCPSWHGAKNWQPGAYNPKTRMIYVPTQENICAVMIGRTIQTSSGATRAASTQRMYIAPGADHLSEVQAWNVDTGKKVWSHNFETSPNWGPIMTTGGGLVFSGGTNDRLFRAFDATTGQVLWEFPTNSGIYAPPSSFMVGGRQYVAVVSGWGQDARSMQARIDAASPGNFPEVPEGGVIWVFALK